jgi:hypothetical protein
VLHGSEFEISEGELFQIPLFNLSFSGLFLYRILPWKKSKLFVCETIFCILFSILLFFIYLVLGKKVFGLGNQVNKDSKYVAEKDTIYNCFLYFF